MSENSSIIKIPEGLNKVVEFTEFCRWCAIPKDIREPKEQKDFAKQFNVSESMLSQWKQTPEYMDNRRRYIQMWIGDDLPELMYSTKKFALRGSSKHLEIILKWLGELADGTNINIDNRTLNINYTQDDLWAGVRALYKQSGLSDEEFLNKIR